MRDIFDGVKSRFKRVKRLEPAIELLVEHDYLRAAPVAPRKGRGRKPSPEYDVNPHTFEHNPQNPQNSLIAA